MTIEIIESYDDKAEIIEALSSLGINLIPLDEFEWEQKATLPQHVIPCEWNANQRVGDGYPARSSNENIVTINKVSHGDPYYAGKTTPLCGIAKKDLVKFEKDDDLNFKIVYFNDNNVTFYFY